MLRPLAYREAPRLVSIREVVPTIAKEYPTLPANARHFEEWRNQATTFASIAAVEWRTTNLTGAGDPAQVVVVRASGSATPLFVGVAVGCAGAPAIGTVVANLLFKVQASDPLVIASVVARRRGRRARLGHRRQ